MICSPVDNRVRARLASAQQPPATRDGLLTCGANWATRLVSPPPLAASWRLGPCVGLQGAEKQAPASRSSGRNVRTCVLDYIEAAPFNCSAVTWYECRES